MIIETVVVTAFFQNARIILDESSAEALVVDPGGDIDRILAALERQKAQVRAVLLTHSHLDHAGGIEPLRDALAAKNGVRPPLYAHRNEAEFRSSIRKQAELFGMSDAEFHNVAEPERYLEDGDEIIVGKERWQVIFTPGHSPGHICFYAPEHNGLTPLLLSGDLLFQGAIGRTDIPGADQQTLLGSIREKLLVLPDATVVKPSHGPDTTIGREKRVNPYLLSMFR